MDTTQIKNTPGFTIENLDEFVKSLQGKWGTPVLEVTKRLIKDAKTSPTNKGQYFTMPSRDGSFLKIIGKTGKFYLKYTIDNRVLRLVAFGKYKESATTQKSVPIGIPRSVRSDHHHRIKRGTDPRTDPVIMAEVKRQQEQLCKREEYCMEIVSVVTNPLDVQTVTTINNKNNDDRALAADILTLVEAYASRKPLLVLGSKLGAKRGDAASLGVAVILNRINTILTGPIREDVKYGDIIVYTTALTLNDGLNSHAPTPESLVTVFPSSVV